jgi:hypothetical protein
VGWLLVEVGEPEPTTEDPPGRLDAVVWVGAGEVFVVDLVGGANELVHEPLDVSNI